MTGATTQVAGPGASGRRSQRTPEHDPLTVRALARGLSILSLFDAEHREWSIDDIAARTGLLRMTAYRMVRTLEGADFLVRDATTNTYHLGPAAIALSYVAEDNSDFVDLARPFLEELVETTGESVTLAIPVDGVPVCAGIIDSARPFQRQIAPGRIIGDLAAVHGKIFTAFAPPDRRAEILARPRRKHTPYTVTDPEALAQAARRHRAGRRRLRHRRPLRKCVLRRLPRPRPARHRRRGPLRRRALGSLRPRGARALHRGGAGDGRRPLRLPRLEPVPACIRVNRLSPFRGASTLAKGQRLR